MTHSMVLTRMLTTTLHREENFNMRYVFPGKTEAQFYITFAKFIAEKDLIPFVS